MGLRQINTCAAKYLYWSIFKKSRHLGFCVFKDIWSMVRTMLNISIRYLYIVLQPIAVLLYDYEKKEEGINHIYIQENRGVDPVPFFLFVLRSKLVFNCS